MAHAFADSLEYCLGNKLAPVSVFFDCAKEWETENRQGFFDSLVGPAAEQIQAFVQAVTGRLSGIPLTLVQDDCNSMLLLPQSMI